MKESGKGFRDSELECEEEEARDPCVLRDPGARSGAEVERHNVTHMPFKSWCPVCVEGKGRDKHIHEAETQGDREVSEIVLDYCVIGLEGEETIAIQLAPDRRTRMIFDHVVPKKVFSHEHGDAELIKDIAKLGYNEIIMKCEGEPAMKTIQEEIRKVREDHLGEFTIRRQPGQWGSRTSSTSNRRASAGATTGAGATTRMTAVWAARRHRMACGASGRPSIEVPNWR